MAALAMAVNAFHVIIAQAIFAKTVIVTIVYRVIVITIITAVNAYHVITALETFVKIVIVKIAYHVTVKMSTFPAVEAVQMAVTAKNANAIASLVIVENVVHATVAINHAEDLLLLEEHRKQATMDSIMRLQQY